MGGCTSHPELDDAEGFQKSKKIEGELKKMNKENLQELKLLLLGIGESGKSTIAKQMKVLYLDGFSEDERKDFLIIVHGNILNSIKLMIAASFKFEIPVAAELLESMNENGLSQSFQSGALTGLITPEQGAWITKLWNDENMKKVYDIRWKYFLPGCVDYFISNLDRIIRRDYIPTTEDILRCRVKTSSIIETHFDCQGTKFRMIDVGGQRSERRKWIHCFQDITALIYVVAISEYDQFLAEAESVPRMVESMELFEELINSIWFRSIAIVLFLNKSDLFREKLLSQPFQNYFPSFTGGSDYNSGIEFLSSAFQVLNKIPERTVFIHPTTATDTNNVQYVFSSVKEFVLLQVIGNLGI